MRRIALVVLAAFVALGTLVPALAGSDDNKPSDGLQPPASEYGLCNAAFNGSEEGEEHKREAPPFQGLLAKAGDQDDDDDVDWDDVAIWCEDKVPGGH